MKLFAQPEKCVAAESVGHLALLALFYLGARGALAHSGEGGWMEYAAATLRHSLLDLALIGGGVGVWAWLVATATGSFRFAVLRVTVALAYLLVTAQMLFRRETGTFFSWRVAKYAAANLVELWKVLLVSVQGVLFPLLFATGALFFLAPIFSRLWERVPRPRWVLALMSVAFMALSFACSKFRSGDVVTEDESVFLALVRNPYPDSAAGGIPAYGAPSVVGDEYGIGRPNIIVIVLESTRADSVPLSNEAPDGRRVAPMPVLASWARRGVVFNNAYTTTSHTSKALVGIFCGIHPYPEMPIIESQPGRMPVTCLPRVLADAGYRTLFIQSATGEFEGRPGLIANLGFEGALYKEQIEEGYLPVGYFGLDEMAIPPKAGEWWSRHGGRPKFLAVLTSMTHHPYQQVGKPVPKEDAHASYLEILSYTDGMLGRIEDVIRDSGEMDNTIVVVTSDHGESFGERGSGPKQHDAVPFDEVTRVPLLVWDGRGRLPAGEDDGLRQHVDLFPTLARLAGVRVEGGPGEDLFLSPGHSRVVTSCWYAGACLAGIEGRMKWIYFPAARRMKAFDLKLDRWEERDVSDKHPVRGKEIAAALLRHRESVRRFYEAAGGSGGD